MVAKCVQDRFCLARSGRDVSFNIDFSVFIPMFDTMTYLSGFVLQILLGTSFAWPIPFHLLIIDPLTYTLGVGLFHYRTLPTISIHGLLTFCIVI